MATVVLGRRSEGPASSGPRVNVVAIAMLLGVARPGLVGTIAVGNPIPVDRDGR